MGGLFDSVLDFESPEKYEVTDRDRLDRVSGMLGQMKCERNKMLDLLKQCDNERILFRKLNLELLKSIVDIKSDEIVVGNKPLKAMLDRGYALNYELLKKTVLKLEDKLLDSEKTMFSQEKKNRRFVFGYRKEEKNAGRQGKTNQRIGFGRRWKSWVLHKHQLCQGRHAESVYG